MWPFLWRPNHNRPQEFMSDDSPRGATRLDPRDPFVWDTAALGRRPGAMRRESRTIPAPGDFGVEMIRVPEGAQIVVDVRLEAVMEGVLASGTARVPLTGECARCLDQVSSDLDVEFQELHVYPESETAGEEEPRLDGDLLDIGSSLRDAVVLTLPLNPLCREDCPGLCADCGVRLADVEPEHDHGQAIDPRLQALASLTDDTNTNDTNHTKEG